MWENNTLFHASARTRKNIHSIWDLTLYYSILNSELNVIFMNLSDTRYWNMKGIVVNFVCFKILLTVESVVLHMCVRVYIYIYMHKCVQSPLTSLCAVSVYSLMIRPVILSLWFCVSEFLPFHLEVWCQVKPTCFSLNSPITVHTCKEKFLYNHVVVLWTKEFWMKWEREQILYLHISVSINTWGWLEGCLCSESHVAWFPCAVIFYYYFSLWQWCEWVNIVGCWICSLILYSLLGCNTVSW
jgi:hypothetical protein